MNRLFDGAWTIIHDDEEVEPTHTQGLVIDGDRAWYEATPANVGRCAADARGFVVTIDGTGTDGSVWVEEVTATVTLRTGFLSGIFTTIGRHSMTLSDPCSLMRDRHMDQLRESST